MMIQLETYTDKAVENFFQNTLELSCQSEQKEELSELYTTQITINHEGKEHQFFIGMGEKMLKVLAQHLLFEDEPDQETMIDLLNESANLIVGNAKLIWEEYDASASLKLTTPEYQGYFEENLSKEFDEKLFFNAGSESIMIGITSAKDRATV